MKKLLLILLSGAAILLKGQSSCNASSFNPLTICPLNSTISIAQSMQTDMIYVCGQNAVVYDTLNPPSIKYRQVYINSGGKYYYKSTGPNNNTTIFAKNGSFCYIMSGSNTGPLFYFNQEPTATLSNMTSNTVTINNCSAITAPTASVNCSATSVGEVISSQVYSLWPNPASDKLILKAAKGSASLLITDQMGRIVREEKWENVSEKEISLTTLSEGIYNLRLNVEGVVEFRKIVVSR